MAKRTFTRDFLLNELDLPYGDNSDYGCKVVSDKVVDNSRWSIYHDLIFTFEGKTYQTSYSVGATESQDESPWEYEDNVECVEVHAVEKTVLSWEPIETEVA